MLRIRHAESRDRQRIARLQAISWRDSYGGELSADYLSEQVETDLADHWRNQQITSRDLVLVAEEESEMLGFIAIWCQSDAFIDNFHVLPECRSRGIGSNLLGVASTSLLVRGHRDVSLCVFEANKKAIQFYQRCGASVVDRQTKTFFGNQVINLRLYWPDIGSILKAVGQQERDKQWMKKPTYNA